MKWLCKPEPHSLRTRAENVTKFLPGVKPFRRNANTVSVKEIIMDDRLQKGLKCTNNEIQVKHPLCINSMTQIYIYYDISLSEFKAFLARFLIFRI